MEVVNFTPRPVYRQGKSLQYPLGKGLGEPQDRYGRSDEKNLCSYRKSNPGRPARSIVTILTEPPRLNRAVNMDFIMHRFCYFCDGVRLYLCGAEPLMSIPQMIYEWIWSSGGMILTGESRSTRRETFPSVTYAEVILRKQPAGRLWSIFPCVAA
jgi:hypothetical protein